MKQTTFEKQLEMYSVFIRDIIRRNQELLESEQINAIDKELLTAYYRLSKFFRGFRQKFGGQLWGREKIKAKN